MKSRQVLVASLFCALALLFVPMAGGVGSETVADSQTAVVESTNLQTESAIDAEVSSANGTVEVLVRINASEVPGEFPDEANQTAVERFQERAAHSQTPLLNYATTTDGVTIENTFWLTNRVLLTVDTAEVPVSALLDVSGVQSVGPNFEVSSLEGRTSTANSGETLQTAPLMSPMTSTAFGGPVTPESTVRPATAEPTDVQTTYGLELIQTPITWDFFNNRGEGSSVAVLDTGIDANHTDLNLSVWGEFDSSGNELDTEPQDYGSHGTHVSGTVAGGNASGQHIGVAPGTELHHGAVLTDCNPNCVGTFSQIIGGMQWAVNNSVDVISLSLGAQGYYSDFIDPVRNAHSAGTIVVGASGNGGIGNSSSPGNVYDAIAVGAVDQNRDVAGFSSGELINTTPDWGTAAPSDWPPQYIVPSISAPGSQIYSTTPGDSYDNKWGTSMATPHVAGATAIIQAVTDAHVPADEMEIALEEAATKPSDAAEPAGTRDNRYGSGIIDIPETIAFIEGPFPRIEQNQTRPYVNESFTLDGSSTFGNITNYHWDYDDDVFIDAHGPIVTQNYSTAGTKNVTLTVTDNQARMNSTAQSVTVIEHPAANFSVNPRFPKPGEEITFDGSVSQGDINSFEWDLNDDGSTDDIGPSVDYTFSQEGRYNVSLNVTDIRGESSELTREVIVSETPRANFTIDPRDPETGETVTFDGTSSIGNITAYEWDLTGDGSIDATGANTTWSYSTNDVVSVTLTVTDNRSIQDSWNQTLIVGIPPIIHNSPPNDLTNDSLYRDIDGDGSFDIFDIQAFHLEYKSSVVQNHPAEFNFDGSGPVDIFDVQALFTDLQNNVAN